MAIKAGTVIIDVEPNTHGFYRKVMQALNGLRDVEIDTSLNTRNLDNQLRRLNDRDERIDIKAVLDNASLMRDVERTRERMQRDMAAQPLRIQWDKSALSKGMADTLREHSAFERALTDQTSRHARLRNREWVSASSLVGELTVKHRDLEKQLNAENAAYAKGHAEREKKLKSLSEAYERMETSITAAKQDRDAFKRNSDEYKLASQHVKDLQKEYKQLGTQLRKTQRDLDAFDAKHEKTTSAFEKQVVDVNTQLRTARASLHDAASAMDGLGSSTQWVASGFRDLDLGLVHATDNTRKYNGEVARQSRAQDKWARTLSSMNPVLGDTLEAVGRMDRSFANHQKTLKASENAVNRFKGKQRKLTQELEQSEDAISMMMKGLKGLNTVDTGNLRRQLTGLNDRLREFHKLASNPVKAFNKFRTSGFTQELDKVADEYDAFTKRMEREHTVNMRVRVLEDNANKVEDQLNRLRSKHLDLPVDIKVDLDNIQAQLREAARNVRMDPDHDWEADLNVDLDMARAEHRIKEFEREHDKLDMDVDLETALARAHLAYFTRPRTVDIFAKFHGADMGKILSGMTAGATGLQGVQNQFRNLVNLFDSLDKVVPKVALLGTVLSDIGAGAINLAGTVGGLGKSIMSMSKAAYAAPAALAGMGLAYASLRMIIGDKAKAWSENINLAGTALEGLGEKLQDTFYGKAAPAFKDFANQVGDVIGPQMQRLASLEADVFNGMLNMVTASNKVGQVGRVFTHVNDSIKLLVPGVESVVRSFLDLSDAGGVYLVQFSNWLSRNMEWFATWARSVQADSSTVDKAMAQVKEQSGYLADSFFALKGVIKGVFEPLAQNQNGIERFAVNLKKAEHAVNSISFQDTMQAWVRGAQDAQHGMRDAFGQIGDAANIMRNDVANVMTSFGQLTGNVFGNLTGLLSRVSPSLSRFADGVKDGFTSISGGLKDAAPMFSQLVSMAGELSRTFGGTFAATLKAAAPMIEQVAKVTESVAKAFNALPESVKGAAGLWMTFGRSGVQAFTALKTGMLENIQNTLQYRKTLADLGLSAGEAGISFGQLVKTQVAMRNGNIAGVLSDTGKAADKAATGVSGVMVNMGRVTGKTGGFIGNVKAAGSALLGAFGGVPGLAITAGIGLATAAISSYSSHVSDLKSVQEGFNEAARATPGVLVDQVKSLGELSSQMDNFSVKVKDAYSQQRSFWDNFDPRQTDFDSVNDALDEIGISVDNASKAAAAGRDDIQGFLDVVDSMQNEYTQKAAETSGEVSESYKKQADAARLVSEKTIEMHNQMVSELKTKAKLVGVSGEYVDSLIAQGQSISSVNEGLLSADEKTERLSSATSKLSGILKNQKSAMIQNMAAGSSYYKLWGEQMPGALEHVKSLLADGQSSWDAQAKSFHLTSEAGRTASDMLTTLASNSTAYLDSMIANGQSVDEVKGKYDELAANFQSAAKQAGVADGDIQGLTESMLGVPDDIKVKVEAQTLQAKSDLVGLVDTVQYLFPDGSRDETRQMLINMALRGDLTPEKLSSLVSELSDENHTIKFTADGKNAYTVLDGVQEYLEHVSGKRWEAYVQAKQEGLDDVEALSKALEGVPNAKETLLKARDEGKSLLEAFVSLLQEVPEYKDSQVNATTTGEEDVARLHGLFADTNTKDATLNGSTTGEEPVARLHGLFASTNTKNPVLNGSTTGEPQVSRLHGLFANTNTKNPALNGRTTGEPQVAHMHGLFTGTNSKSPTLTGIAVDRGVFGLAGTWHGIQSKEVTLTTRVRQITEQMTSGKAPHLFDGGLATGGRIHGPGTGTSDSIPAMLSNNEHVIRAASVAKLDRTVGPNFLNVLNRTGDVDKALANANNRYLDSAQNLARAAYATGGRVQAMFEKNATVVVDGGRTVNQTFNLQTKIVRSDQDLHSAAQIDRAALMRTARREARL